VNKKRPEIVESADELQRLLRAERDIKRRQRLQALYLLASHQARTRQQVAALLGVHRHTVASWLQAYERGRLEGLLTYRVPVPTQGRRITAAALADLQQRLADPKGFASYGQIQTYLAEQHQVQLAYSTVHALVRYELKAKPKAPRRSHEKKAGRYRAVSA
jgi:transposase